MKKLILIAVLVAFASPSFAQTAKQKEMEQQLEVQMAETSMAKWHIEAVKAENYARVARAEAEFEIQKSRLRGMCEAIEILDSNAFAKLCFK